MDKRQEKRYRVCIQCDTLSLNKELLRNYDQCKEDLHFNIEQLKNKLEGSDKDVGEVEN